MQNQKPFLEVKNLTLAYKQGPKKVFAVNDVSLTIEHAGQALAVVGESGCGKSSLAKAILQILPNNIAEFSGEVLLEGKDVRTMSVAQLRKSIWWKKISWVPQDAMNMFNPVYKVGQQIEETLMVHGVAKEKRRDETLRLLRLVGLGEHDADKYPHEFSGGMLQRAAIALALALNPSLVILDEPTSALDVSLQGGIINLLQELKEKFNLSYIFITHDIVLATKLCDSFAVLYGGRIAEYGTREAVIENPMHKYTQALLDCVPTFDVDQNMTAIPGEPPHMLDVKNACPFADRPAIRCDNCRESEPPTLVEVETGHWVARHQSVSD